MARHLLEDVSFAAVDPCWLTHHTSEEEHVPVQGEQGAAGAHGAAGVLTRCSAAHLVGHQVSVSFQTHGKLVVHQGVKSERALESRPLLWFLPASDHRCVVTCHQNALSKVSFWQTGSNHVSFKDDAVAELNHSQVVFRATFHIARVDMNHFNIQRLLVSITAAVFTCAGDKEGR